MCAKIGWERLKRNHFFKSFPTNPVKSNSKSEPILTTLLSFFNENGKHDFEKK